MSGLRTIVRWSSLALVPGDLVWVLCLASGISVPTTVRIAAEAAMLAVVASTAVVLTADYRRHRRTGLERRAASLATIDDTAPVAARKLIVHEFNLGTSFLRWVARRRPHGARPDDVTVPYASGQTAVVYGFLFVSIVETVVLAYLIPWAVLRSVTLVLDVWGVYFILALHASCVVRPHLIGADGSLRLRYGALLDIQIPAGRIASARLERRYSGNKLGVVDADGAADLAVAGETTVTLELTAPVEFVRVLGRPARAQTFRFYADDPTAAVSALCTRRTIEQI